MRGQQMIRKAIRSSVTALAVAFFAVPQISLAQAANDQVQVDPLMQKAARIKNMNSQMRITQAQRVEAAKEQKANVERVKAAKAAARAKGIEVPEIGIRGVKAERMSPSIKTMRAGAPRSTSASALPSPQLNGLTVGPLDTPDYFTTANWAFSPMLRKFVDTLPGLGSGAPNNIGNYVPLAHPDTRTYPGSDYYEISLKLYEHRFHSDLPATKVRGYVQTNLGTNAGGTLNNVTPDPINWLGPVIVAVKDRPIRIKFKNELPGAASGGNLAVPVDESIQGSGRGAMWPDGTECNPSPMAIGDPGLPCAVYPQTRAAIHLHGGRTPWISDGTPFQWILPLADYDDGANPYKKGVSLYNVPDMPVPATNDETTYYWSNQQSSRLMFYHDHAWGITRLNVLAGEAAGLLINDRTENDLIAEGILPDLGIPLVIQDRTFVDANVNIRTGKTFVRDTDPTWNWGTGAVDDTGVVAPVTGDFWIPHVYVPAQNPYTPSGVNAFGRWVYGPWFFPPTANLIYPPTANPYFDANCGDPDPAVLAFCTTPNQPPVIPGTPTPSVGAETFFDTAMVNGQAFPVLDLQPKPYRFRILNAANDRFQNLNIYKADPLQVTHPHWGGLPVAQNTEVEMCAIPGAAGIPGTVCWDQNLYPNWPNDGRTEGVPNPTKLGPDIIYLGTEGGFLPKPVVLKGQPITFVTDPTAFNVGNVKDFNLFMGPAERADVIIDFSNFGGEELILYNDAPAAVPAFDPRFDYITGAPDLSANGGYGRVPPWNEADPAAQLEGPQAGYGPNTRTVMKFRIAAGTGPGYDLAALNARWLPGLTPAGRHTPLGVFEESQDQIIVGQSAGYDGVYTSNPSFPSVWPAWGISRIEDNSLMFETVSGTIVTFPMEPKAMHDEMGASFDKEYARMSTNLGTQLNPPKTNAANMTPYMYTDPATEFMNAAATPVSAVLGDGTQLWKISHNGVDMHPIHFHIFDVQVINRVGWDGQIRLPAEQEYGWKDTVRIAPLEDTIVAMRPWTPPIPFNVPFSLRALNPAIPIGSGYGFTNIDPITQAPLVPPTTNAYTSFAWEYVWHCHILSHEENDMMRPIVLNVPSVIPPAIAPISVVATAGTNTVSWTDPTPVNYLTQTGFKNANNDNEIGFRIERATSVNSGWEVRGTARANATSWAEAVANPTPYYRYRVVAFNEAGTSTSPFAQIGTAPVVTRLTSVSLAISNAGTQGAGIVVTANSNTWTKNLTSLVSPNFRAAGSGGNPAAYEYQFSMRLGAAQYGVVQSWSPSANWVMPLGTAPGVYTVQVEARNGPTIGPRTRTLILTVAVPAAVTGLALNPSIVSPATVGNAVNFTAVATGGAATKQYQYSLATGQGVGLTYVVQSAWSAATTWLLPATTPVGLYTVMAEVRTNTGSVDRTATVAYEIVNPPATGVTIVAEKASPGTAPVSFLATGEGPAPLTTGTGGGYYFKFTVSNNGGSTFTYATRPYGTSRVYTLPLGTPPGSYIVRVQTATRAIEPATFDGAAQITYVVNTFPTVTLTSAQNPSAKGATVLFTAVGTGPGTHQYRFSLDGTPVSVPEWGPTNTWTMPGTTLGGSHAVLVEISDAPPTAQSSATVTQFVTFPPATLVTLTPSVASPQIVGTPVTLTAAGSGSDPGAVYSYRFRVDGADATGWQTEPTFLLPTSTVGTYSLTVDTTTVASPTLATPADVTSTPALSYVIRDWAPPTSVQFQTISPASPSPAGTAVTFVAVALGSTDVAAPYQYRFSRDGGTNWTAWSATSSYSLDAAAAAATYTIAVQATTSSLTPPTPTVANSVSHVLYATPAVTLVANPTSGRLWGTSVTFTASGSGGMPPVTSQYRFSLNGVVDQGWSASPTYITTALPVRSNTVLVEYSTTATPAVAASASTTFVITGYPAATAVTIDNGSPASPQKPGTAITFTASGVVPAGLPTGAVKYRFKVDSGTAGAWSSTTPTFALPLATAAGNHTVTVDVTTANNPTAGTNPDISATSATYVLANPTTATGVRATFSPASPRVVNTPITLTLTGSGSTIGVGGPVSPQSAYQFQVGTYRGPGYAWVWSAWVSGPTYTWTPATAGAWTVVVRARTNPASTPYEALSPYYGYTVSP